MPPAEVVALALNVPVPTEPQWTDSCRGEDHVLQSITVRLLPEAAADAAAARSAAQTGRGERQRRYTSLRVRR